MDLNQLSDNGVNLLAQSNAVGSDTWLGADVYEANDQFNKQIVKFFKAVKWDILASITLKIRGKGGKSHYTSKYSVGQFNMVRRLNFEDRVSWVVRIRLPPEATPAPLALYNSRRAFEVEIASMKFFKSKSSVSVPEVFAYNYDPSNEVGVPYMFMEYVQGTTASNLQEIRESRPGLFGTLDQDRKFREQMAKIQAEVQSFKFPQIGSLYWSEEISSFYIGPDVDTGGGPWASSTDYYRDFTDELLKRTAARCGERAKSSPSFSLPILLNRLMDIYSEECAGPFRLVNRDFGVHNILVDGDFNIVGIVDFDAVGPAPLKVAAQYPVLSAMDLDPPCVLQTNPYAIERIERTKPQLARYKEWLAMYEAQFCEGSFPVSNKLESTAAMAYQGMLRYA